MRFIQRQWLQAKILVRSKKTLFAYLAGILSWIGVSIIGGVLGNAAYEIWVSNLKPWFDAPAPVTNFLLLVVMVVGTLAGIVLSDVTRGKSKNQNRDYSIAELSTYLSAARSQELFAYQKIMADINSQFQMSFLGQGQDRLSHLMDKYFLAIYNHLGPETVNGGGIILLEENREWLFFWRMGPDQALSPKRFYIGSDADVDMEKPRGVGGSVYLSGKAQIVKINNRLTGESDNPLFHHFNMEKLGHPRYVIPYESFICLPIRFNGQVIGVLSLECMKRDFFDEEIAYRLQPIADQLGTILYCLGATPIMNTTPAQ